MTAVADAVDLSAAWFQWPPTVVYGQTLDDVLRVLTAQSKRLEQQAKRAEQARARRPRR